jgi:AsmA protein
MRALKILAWIAGILIVLLIAGFFALRVILPPEKLRAMVLPRVEQALGQRVEVGSFQLAIWGGFGVAVEDVRLGNRPGYGDEHMLTLDRLVLRIPLRPLLRRQLEIRRVALVGPRVFAEKSAEGQLNVAGLGQRLSPAEEELRPERAKPTQPVALPIPITLESFSIEKGFVRYSDVEAGLTAEIEGIHHRARLTMDPALENVRLQGDLAANGVHLTTAALPTPLPSFDLQISHRAKMDMTRSMLTLESVDITALGAKLSVKGTVEDFEAPFLHLQTDLVTSLASLVLKEGVELTGTLTSDIRVEGPALDPEQIQLLGTVAIDRLNLRTPEMPVPLKDVTGQIILKGQDVEIPAVSGSLGSSTLNLRAAIARAIPFAATGGKAVPEITFDLRCPHLVVDEFLPDPDVQTGASAGSGPTAADSSPPPIPPIPAMAGTGTVVVERITAMKLEARDFIAKIEMLENQLRVSEFSGDIYSGNLHGDASVELHGPARVRMSGSVHADQVQANDFVSALTSFDDHLFGQLDLTGTFDATGLTPEEIRRTLTGDGHVSVAQGRLVNWDLARDLSKWIKFLEFEDVDFNNMAIDFEIGDERVAMHPLKLNALDTWWEADGSVGFDQTLDYRVVATLSRAATRRMQEQTSLTGLITTDIGQAEIMFFVTGNAKSPRFKWNTENIQEQAKDRAKDELADVLMKEADKRLEGDVRDAAKKILGDFLKADSTDTTGSDDKLEDLKKEGEDLLKGLFGKKKKKD